MKRLGKILNARFGLGGYQDAMIGISFTLGGDSWGVADFWGTWAMKPDPVRAKWTEAEQIEMLGKVVLRLAKLLEDAKVQHVDELVGVPVEVEIDANNALASWRILTEVR